MRTAQTMAAVLSLLFSLSALANPLCGSSGGNTPTVMVTPGADNWVHVVNVQQLKKQSTSALGAAKVSLDNPSHMAFILFKGGCGEAGTDPQLLMPRSGFTLDLSIPTNNSVKFCVRGRSVWKKILVPLGLDLVWIWLEQEHLPFAALLSNPGATAAKYAMNKLFGADDLVAGWQEIKAGCEKVGFWPPLSALKCAGAIGSGGGQIVAAFVDSEVGKMLLKMVVSAAGAGAVVAVLKLKDTIGSILDIGNSAILTAEDLTHFVLSPDNVELVASALGSLPQSETVAKAYLASPAPGSTFSGSFTATAKLNDFCNKITKIDFQLKASLQAWQTVQTEWAGGSQVSTVIDADSLTPGKYSMRIRYHKGAETIEGSAISITIQAPPPPSTVDAAVTSQSWSVKTVDPGTPLSASFTLKNTGTLSWPAGSSLATTSSNFQSASLPTLASGQTTNIVVTGAAPPNTGTFTYIFRPQRPDGSFFGGAAKLTVKVAVYVPPPVNTTQLFESKATPAGPVVAGSKLAMTVTFQNTGNQVWVSGPGGVGNPAYVELRAVDAAGKEANSLVADSTWINPQRIGSFQGTKASGGQYATFKFTASIPKGQPEGSETVRFRLYHASKGWLPGSGPISMPLQIVAGPESEGVFPQGKFLYPIGGEKLLEGQTIDVLYDASGGAKVWNIWLDYSTNGGKTLDIEVGKLDPALTSFSWTIPPGVTSQGKLRMAIEATNGYATFVETPGVFSVSKDCDPLPSTELWGLGTLAFVSDIVVHWDELPTATGYELQMAQDESFSSPATIQSVDNEAPVTGLDTGNYWFRVRGTSDCEPGAWSNVVKLPVFINKAPDLPAPVTPGDGAVGVSIETKLQWTANDPDDQPLAYALFLDPSSPPGIKQGYQPDDSWQPPAPLKANTTYYWRIKVKDEGNLETLGPIWSFTTGNQVADVGVKLTGVTGNYAPNGSIDVAWSATNGGSFETEQSPGLRFYLSKAPGDFDIELNKDTIFTGKLGPGETVTGTETFKLGAIDAGTSYVELKGLTSFYFPDASADNDTDALAVTFDDTSPPDVEMKVPFTVNGDGETLAAGTSYYISWSADDDTGLATVDLHYSTDKKASFKPIVSGFVPGSNGFQASYSWEVPALAGGTEVWLKGTFYDAAENATTVTLGPFFIIDSSGPSVTFEQPSAGAGYVLGQTITAKWTTTSTYPVKDVFVSIHTPGSSDTLVKGSTDPGTASWTIPLNVAIVTEKAYFYIRVEDQYGQHVIATSPLFTITDASEAPQPWSKPAALGGDGSWPAACSVDSSDKAHIVYRQYVGGTQQVHIRTASDGALGSPSTVIANTVLGNEESLDIAVDASNRRWVLYNTKPDKAIRVVHDGSGSWSSPFVVSDTGKAFILPTIAASGTGVGACWREGSAATCSFSTGGAFGGFKGVGSSTAFASIAGSAGGSLTGSWRSLRGS